jgi:uncharacterized membrane protein
VRGNVRKLAIAGLLAAISFVMGYVFPVLGFIPVPTAAGSATIMHIPAVLGAVAEGPMVGAFVGAIFGLLSLMRATVPMFADPLVAVLPRIMIGVTAYYAFIGFRRFGLTTGLTLAAVIGTLTNTVLVLGIAAWRGYLAPKVALGLGVIHGLPEVVVAVLLTVAVGLALARAGYIRTNGKSPANRGAV